MAGGQPPQRHQARGSFYKKRVKDERDFTDSNRVHASLASRGESIYTGVKGELTLAVEAVTPDECRISHDGADVAPLKSGRRR